MSTEKQTPSDPASQTHNPMHNGDVEKQTSETHSDAPLAKKKSAFQSLGFLDRFLAVWILLAMVLGVLLGNFVPNTAQTLEKGKFVGVSVPIGMSSSFPQLYKVC